MHLEGCIFPIDVISAAEDPVHRVPTEHGRFWSEHPVDSLLDDGNRSSRLSNVETLEPFPLNNLGPPGAQHYPALPAPDSHLQRPIRYYRRKYPLPGISYPPSNSVACALELPPSKADQPISLSDRAD